MKTVFYVCCPEVKRGILTIFIFFLFISSYASSFVGGRTDFRDETIYFVITTRFYDGDKTNNVYCWDGQALNAGDPSWRGDFKGLIEKLDYIKALGFSAVWITPVVENMSGFDYHGYHASSFKKVDSRYLSEDTDFRTLIDAVHARDMKLILDVVFNHCGNFGEETLCPMFVKDETVNPGLISSLKRHPESRLPADYDDLAGGEQFQARLALMKNTDGQNHDSNNYWHHCRDMSWESVLVQWSQIAGDCVDLNTENPVVYNYLIDCYSKFIEMGVDGFRIDTGKHISRLVFNKVFNPAFMKKARECGKPDFFMFSEVCTRVNEVWNHNMPCISAPFYTWKESKEYAWSEDASEYTNKNFPGALAEYETTTNWKSCSDNFKDNDNTTNQPTSDNVFLNGNAYHSPDYSKYSELSVIDFPMHWNFSDAGSAFRIAKEGDRFYNDASFNVTYVDSHDYGPNMDCRFMGGTDKWAGNLSLMFTFRGIPCLYYGSEIEFKAGVPMDKGPDLALRESGRAYFGGYITGNISITDFSDYTNASGNIASTLASPLAVHLQRLNKIRKAIPALRKGQYSVDGCNGGVAFKRRYTDTNTDSYVLVTINGGATFSGVENGTYVDAITGDTKTVGNGTLTATCSGEGNMRVYVLNTSKTPAPGKIGEDGPFLYGTSPVNVPRADYDGKQEALDDTPLPTSPDDPDEPVIETPVMYEGELAAFFEAPSDGSYGSVSVWCWNDKENFTGGSWPGKKATRLGKTGNGNKLWKWTYDGSFPANMPTQIIFSNSGSPQTADLSFVNGGYYDVGGYVKTIQPVATGISEPIMNQSIKVCVDNGELFIWVEEDRNIDVVSIDGRVVRYSLQKGMNPIQGLAKGVYLVAGKKVIL